MWRHSCCVNDCLGLLVQPDSSVQRNARQLCGSFSLAIIIHLAAHLIKFSSFFFLFLHLINYQEWLIYLYTHKQISWETMTAQWAHTDAEVHSCSRRRAALASRHSLGRLRWSMVERLVGRNKAQSLFTATDGPVHKRSSNLIRILTRLDKTT